METNSLFQIFLPSILNPHSFSTSRQSIRSNCIFAAIGWLKVGCMTTVSTEHDLDKGSSHSKGPRRDGQTTVQSSHDLEEAVTMDSSGTVSRTASRTSANAAKPLSHPRSKSESSDSRSQPQDGRRAHSTTDDNEKSPEAPASDEDKQYEVDWDDGDDDPMCPRSFNKLRKWIITSVVSFASFTV